MQHNSLTRLCRLLDYNFTNISLLQQALTHCSRGEKNNEIFEFLGDSILSFIISSTLVTQFSHRNEGELSRLRAYLVKGERLAEIALTINLGDFLLLGQGELKSGGFRRASILADALEAIIAAVYLDGGIEASKKVVLKLFADLLRDPALENNLKDAKTKLQEFLQGNKFPLPLYNLLKIEGEDQEQIFHINGSIPGFNEQSLGTGSTRRKAEQVAAQQLLALISKSSKKK